ncbi:hypothetical protein BDZ89DRAFT_1128556 [Hymenopellis radicata]|nr:hypothetical protein BDZ89DRAFT_1128556 [Hymenopellis radicata]
MKGLPAIPTSSLYFIVFDESIWEKALGSPTTASKHWWSSKPRMGPWRDTTKKHTISTEQGEGWDNVKKRVAKVASSILGTTLGYEALLLSMDLLEFPLQNAARPLLQIWDSLQLVDNAAPQEIKDTGDQVGKELRLPMTKLDRVFESVRDFLIKEADRPFLKRYLQRDENRREIAGCDNLLHEAFGMFSRVDPYATVAMLVS